MRTARPDSDIRTVMKYSAAQWHEGTYLVLPQRYYYATVTRICKQHRVIIAEVS